jgi:hypothetical protein
MDIFDDELVQLWKAFQRNRLKFIMVGGFATSLHGFMRTTEDVDIWIKNNLENRKALRKSLIEAEIGDFPTIETMDFVPGWTTIHLFSGLDLDVMTNLKEFEESRFEECYQMASKATIQEIEVPFLHLNHLIEEKKATNRPKDQIDVLALEEIKKLRDG